ncbi:thioredoxin domain-containing protein [soil metagenome]
MNRLTSSTSPYLQGHANNPVDWWEWGEPAFAEARRRNVPVLLSVGYAACHWCHVMAHESFEDEQVAEALNAGYVPVKVDREERPDVDAVYMSATTAMTGHGGWPMTCLLTPEGEPFWCGTYLPKPQFLQLLDAAGRAWRDREQEMRAGGVHVVEVLREAQARERHTAEITEDVLAGAVSTLHGAFDEQHGGFGSTPKFPPSMVLEFLLRRHARTGDVRAWEMAERTAVAMARSGTYDQVGGGFARYAVDRGWVVPHFEKMLYDNAQLIRVYAHLRQRAAGEVRRLAERVVRESVQFLLDDLGTGQGGFASSLDADTDGVEGATYVWTPAQLGEVLGERDGQRAAELLLVTEEGTFEHGTSTLQLPRDPQDPAWWAQARIRLLNARDGRPQPARDDKVVTAWNGLAIAALAEAGFLLEEPTWVAAAGSCADLVLDLHMVDGRLRRSSRHGVVGAAEAVAEDIGDLVEGLLALHAATADGRWLSAADGLLSDAVHRFGDGSGAFHDTAHDAEQLVLRPGSRGDNAEPCGQSALAGALVGYGALAGSVHHLDLGRAALAQMGQVARQSPRFAGWAMAAAESLAAGPLQVALAAGEGGEALVAAARAQAPPGTLVVVGAGDDEGVPLLAGRGSVDGRAAAYLCRGTVCGLPVTDPGVLRQVLGGR